MVICSLAGSKMQKCRKDVIGFTGLFILLLVFYSVLWFSVLRSGKPRPPGALDFDLNMIFSKVTEKKLIAGAVCCQLPKRLVNWHKQFSHFAAIFFQLFQCVLSLEFAI